MEMISLKHKEIEARFSKGEGLSNDDINTLLLKYQFKNINHLDKKLYKVTADVASLKTHLRSLEAKFGELKAEIKLKIQTAINKNM